MEQIVQNHLVKKENDNMVHLVPYASGDGSMSFVFQNKYNSDASNVKVTYRDVEEYAKNNPQFQGWKFLRYGPGMIKAYQPVERISTDELTFEGKTFFYTKNSRITAFNCYQIFTEDHNGKTVEVKNENIRSARTLWLDHVESYL